MLRDDALAALYERLGLSAEARTVVETIRASPPARRVRGATGNVAVRYPSRKMGVTIQAESHRNELAGLVEYEHDAQVLEFYDQPPSITLAYTTGDGRAVRVRHTPDYFVLRTDAIGWEEWKTEAELERLAVSMPHRYDRTEDGRWRCPPGERCAEPLGLYYRVRSSAEIDWVFQRNLLFLEDYLRMDGSPVTERAAATVLSLAAQQPGLRLDELLTQLDGASSDDVYALIATERLYVDLHAAALAEPDRVHVFRDAGIAAACAAPEIPIGLGRRDGIAPSPLRCLSAEARERLTQASPDDFREANRRYAILAGSTAPGDMPPARTIRHWRTQYRRAEQTYGCGYVGLLTRRAQSGNRRPKLPPETRVLLDAFIADEYETLKQKRRFEVHAALVRACEAQGVVAPSYKTFTRAVNRRPRAEQIGKPWGWRMTDDHLAPCELWDLTCPAIPPRSRLFHLAPIGIGTPWTESLTGYLARLAEAHGVLVRSSSCARSCRC